MIKWFISIRNIWAVLLLHDKGRSGIMSYIEISKKVLLLTMSFLVIGSIFKGGVSASIVDEKNLLNRVNKTLNKRTISGDALIKETNEINKILEYMNLNPFLEENEELYNKIAELGQRADFYINPEDYVQMKVSKKTWRYGDILMYGAGSKNAVGEKSFTGHTAVLSTTTNYVIEASKTKSSGNKVHHWNRTNLWKGASKIKQYKVTSKLGKNATTAKRKSAVAYGLKQKGEPYKLKTALTNESSWYCSKLTHKMWDKQGYDLRADILNFYVTPSNIKNDLNTREVKNWGSKLPSAY